MLMFVYADNDAVPTPTLLSSQHARSVCILYSFTDSKLNFTPFSFEVWVLSYDVLKLLLLRLVQTTQVHRQHIPHSFSCNITDQNRHLQTAAP